MLKLFRNFILLSLPLIILSFVAYLMPMDYMSVEYTMWQEESDFVNQPTSRPYDTLIIGDSRAKSSIIPEQMGKNAAKVVEVVGTKIDVPRWKAAKQEIRELIASVQK